MIGFNIFRILADLCHLVAICILIFSIHRNRSAEGVSLITQIFYAIVFITRYTDIFREEHRYNLLYKIFFLVSSFYTIGIMRFVYPRTREREAAWKLGAAVLGGSLVVSPLVMLIFREYWSLKNWFWVVSQILESVCVVPQLLLLRQTTVPTVITSFYILLLGSYRGLYILNWIWRGLDSNDRPPSATSVTFGIIQTALYIDFAWVYWTRQRVKLRNGGVVDADDMRRGWLINRIFGKHVAVEVDDEESAPALGGSNGRPSRAKWGARGISVSADDGVLDAERSFEEHGVTDVVDPDAKMQDPDELARVLDEDDEDAPLPGSSGHHSSGVRNGDEWDDD